MGVARLFLDETANAATILLLLAIFRRATGEHDGQSLAPRFLRVTAQVAAIVFAVWVGISLLRFGFIPYLYTELRDIAIQNGQSTPTLSIFVLDFFKPLLMALGSFAVPCIVFKSCGPEPDPPTVDEAPSAAVGSV